MATTRTTRKKSTTSAAASRNGASKTVRKTAAAAPRAARKTATRKKAASPASSAQTEIAIEPITRKAVAKTEAAAPRAGRKAPSRRAPASPASGTETTTVVEPVMALQQLVIENTGKFAELQIGAWRRYSDAIFNGCREMATIGDAEAFQSFVARQPDAVRDLTSAAAADLQAATRIGIDYVTAAGDIIGRAFKQAA